MAKELESLPSEAPICSTCSYLDNDPPWSVPNESTFGELKASVELGDCRSCKLIWDGINLFDVPLDLENITLQRRNLPLTFNVEIKSKAPTGPKSQFLEFYVLHERSQPFLTLERLSDISGDTSSGDAFSWAFQLFQDCLTSHDCCKRPNPAILPTRVIDLREVADGDANSIHGIKLYESQGESADYICLSHCWGSHQPLKTMTSTLQEHKRNIAWSSLPKTFQDAITFARRLRVPYLWIDSLCIIQDDKEDWQRESGRMCSVFEGSILTIAASKSADARGGLFAKSSPEYLAHPVRAAVAAGSESKVHVRRPLPHFSINRHEYEKLDGFPLLTRAWVYQERLLPTRVLHFGPEELLWECLQETQCECSNLGAAIGIWRKPDKEQVTKAFEDDSVDALAQEWREIVRRYSRASMTFESDKLPALSGIAKHFQRHRKDIYIAGLWKETLIRDLLWFIDDGKFAKIVQDRPKKWRAPSWSWASAEGEVCYPHSEMEMHTRCSIREVQCETAGLDSTGAVRSAHLKISGELYKLRAVVTEKPPNETSASSTQYSKMLTLCAKGWIPSKGSFSPDYDLSCTETGVVNSGDRLYGILIGKDVHWQYCHEYYYLVLRLLNREMKLFERVGLLNDSTAPNSQHSLRHQTRTRISVTII